MGVCGCALIVVQLIRLPLSISTIPRVKGMPSKLHDSKIFSKIDLKSGYYSIIIGEGDVRKTNP